MDNWLSILLDTISPPALARRFSEVKAQPGELYFHVLAQRSACLKVEEPITLFRILEITLPAVLLELEDELELLLLPPNRPPRMPETAEPMVDVEVEVAVEAVDGVVVAVVAAVVAVVVVDFFVVVVFFVVFFTGWFCEREVPHNSLAMLPVAPAITRAAVKITFFIPILIFIN